MTTIVQQIDAQGPVVVERISTQFADVACTPENARKLVEALHSGTSVTLTADGKTATFTPTGKLGYGESYIALALAAEALRSAGVTGCATPEQWKAVLLGGPLTAAGTSTTSTSMSSSASSSSQFPGVLALRSQGQGWGQIAKTTNVQLGEVVSSARTKLNISASGDTSGLSPTGQSSSEFNRSRSSSDTTSGSGSTGSTTGSGTLSPSSQSSSSSGSLSSPGASSNSTRSSTDRSRGDDEDNGKGKDNDRSKSGSNRDRSSGSDDSSSSSIRSTSPSSSSGAGSSSSSDSSRTSP